MTAIKTQLGAKDQAADTSFPPSATIPRTDVWRAIQYVYDTLSAALALASAAAVLAQYAADAAQSLAQTALGLAKRSEIKARNAQVTADDSRQIAMTARGATQRAQTQINKLNDVQLALKAQVFN